MQVLCNCKLCEAPQPLSPKVSLKHFVTLLLLRIQLTCGSCLVTLQQLLSQLLLQLL